MTVGVKRGHQLMLNESPVKKAKANNNKTTNEGPTIHELDSELDLPTDLYEDEALVSLIFFYFRYIFFTIALSLRRKPALLKLGRQWYVLIILLGGRVFQIHLNFKCCLNVGY